MIKVRSPRALLTLCIVLLTLLLLFIGHSAPLRVVFRGRLKLTDGRCINVADKSIVVGYCEPSSEQGSFTLYSNGSLLHDASSLCISYYRKGLPPKKASTLGACDSPFTYTNNKLRAEGPGEPSNESEALCLGNRRPHPCIGSPILLRPDCDRGIHITVVEEAAFQKSIEALTRNSLPVPYERNDEGVPCDFQACSINRRVESVKLLSSVVTCEHPALCVTVVVKTARRPHLILRLAASIRTVLGYDLKIVCVADGPDGPPHEIVAQLKEYNIDYFVGWEDMGISVGRNLALKKVRTKYFMLVDDDHVFIEATKIAKMVDILDRTDASLVGGRFEKTTMFAGTINFQWSAYDKIVRVLHGYCQGPEFETCTQCDVTSNVFIAKLSDISQFGGWTDELKVNEHTDFFVKMKSFGLKVVYCDDVRIENTKEPGNEEYTILRHDKAKLVLTSHLFEGRYNVDGFSFCGTKLGANGEPLEVNCNDVRPSSCKLTV